MRRQDFHFELPDELIAQFPLQERRASRLLCLDRESGAIEDSNFDTLLDRLRPDDLLVFNDTRVIRARLFGTKATGGKVEILIERVLNERECLAHMRVSKKPKPGDYIYIGGIPAFQLVKREGDLFHLRFTQDSGLYAYIEQHGHMPLPPYITRADGELDESRYQTVYAKKDGAVAAPTAGLHFDDEMMHALEAKGVQTAYVTLHVGAGTFQPVKVDDILEHKMHAELVEVSEHTAKMVNDAHAKGGRVIAIGTTVVRSLESSCNKDGQCERFLGDTNIFIYPGYQFKCIDGLLTNFHLPESTLIMLVAAFAGKENVLAAYRHAVQSGYRFFSYGDAMFLARA